MAVAFGRVGDRELLASAGDETCACGTLASGQPVGDPLISHTSEVMAVAFGAVGDRDLLASADGNGSVHLWDPASGEPVGEPLTGHTDWLTAVAFGHVARLDLLASASMDRTVRLWDPAAGRGLAVLPTVVPPVAVALSSPGAVVSTGRALCLIAPQ